MDFSAVAALCKELNVNFTMVDTQIAEILLSIARKAIPVPLCKNGKGAFNSKQRIRPQQKPMPIIMMM